MPHVPLTLVDGELVGTLTLPSGKSISFSESASLVKKRKKETPKKYRQPPPPTPKAIKPKKQSGAWRRHKAKVKKESPLVDTYTLNRSYIPLTPPGKK